MNTRIWRRAAPTAAMALLLGSAAPLAADPPSASLARSVQQDLGNIYRTQLSNGALQTDSGQSFYAQHPLLATMALDAHDGEANVAFLSQSASAIGRYYSHLLSTMDRNGNLVLESTAAQRGGGRIVVDHVGLTSVLAIDMINLARLHLRIRQPLRALHWYEGSRTIQGTVISRHFDPESAYFYSTDAYNGSLIRNQEALGAAPALFFGYVGENHTNALVARHLLSGEPRFSDPPLQYLGSAQQAPELGDANSLLKGWLLLEVLHATGFENEAVAARDRMRSLPGVPASASAAARYLEWCVRERSHRIYDPMVSMDLLTAVVRYRRRFDDARLVRLERSVGDIRAFGQGAYTDSDVSPGDLVRVEQSVRNVYSAVSDIRQRMRGGHFLNRADSYEYPGVDPVPAIERLLNDVVSVLRTAENRLFELRNRDTGMYASATLTSERVLAGDSGTIKWTIGSLVAPVELRSVVSMIEGRTDTLVRPRAPATVQPGQNQRVFTSQFVTDARWAGTLVPVTFTLVVEDGEGRRSTVHALRSIYPQSPVEVAALFPNGRILSGSTVPIDLKIVKRTATPLAFKCRWYSPSGLRLKEGNLIERNVASHQDTVTVRLNVIVPDPCRPGMFPFRMKFYGDDQDIGSIASDLFRSYQWLSVGPFTPTADPIRDPLSPERGFDLQTKFDGGDHLLSWMVVPETACMSSGYVSMRGVLRRPGVGYLYTVIESSYGTETAVVLSSNAPSVLFVNGQRVLETPEGGDGTEYARAQIRQGQNEILVKTFGDDRAAVFFNLGDENSLASDEFNNNLWELIPNYGEFYSLHRQDGDVDDSPRLVTLRYRDPDANTVSVIGSFNGWSPDHHRMRKDTAGAWEITLSLTPGRYTYRFLVNNRQQVLDPSTKTTEPDGYGGQNSVIIITE